MRREREGGIWSFLAAVIRSWRRLALAFAIGASLLTAATLLEGKSFDHVAVSGLEHLGMAFFVAAIAVFGYEWQSHYKELFAKIKEVNTAISDLRELVKSEARVTIEKGLHALFPDDSHELNRQIRVSLQHIVQSIDVTEAARAWNRDVYIALVAGMLKSASDSSRLTDVLPNQTGWFELTIPTATELADFMLAAQMNALQQGDKYIVVSDFSSWTAATDLDAFKRATQNAFAKGVTVMRLFAPFPHDGSISIDRALDALEDHWAIARENSSAYVVGLTVESVTEHEGVFLHGTRMIKFRPMDRHLRRIDFFQRENDPSVIQTFEKLWATRTCDSGSDPLFNREERYAQLAKVWKKQRDTERRRRQRTREDPRNE